MRYSKYPCYRDSGVEWLGKIPSEWRSLKIKNICVFSKGWGLSKSELSDNGINQCILYGELFTTYKGVNSISIVNNKTNSSSGKLSNGNEILVPGSTTTTGIDLASSKYLPYSNVLLGGDIVIILPRIKNYDERYVSYFLTNVNSNEFAKAAKGVTIVHIYSSAIREMPIYLPSLQEQQTIANYLDSTIVKIDSFIEKQTKLISLLKEKQQAVISTAVTRGLDNTVSMKDTGIECLGKIPEHWKLPQIARILLLMEQGKSPECDNNVAEIDAWGVLKTSCVNNAIYNSEANKTLPSSIQPFTQYEVKEEDILMSRASGSINLIGSVAYVYKTRPKILLSDKIFRLYVDKSVNKIFFTYLMGSEYMRTNIKMAISGGEGMANNIAKSSITKFKMALPSIDEQCLIVKYIDDKTSKIDNLISKSTKAIDLLKEKRTALISSVVTGKIDVREIA